MVKMNQIKNYIRRNKEGGILGGVAGFLATWAYRDLLGGSLMFAVQSQSVFDTFFSNVVTTSTELAFTKVGTILILLGVFIGMWVDDKVKWL